MSSKIRRAAVLAVLILGLVGLAATPARAGTTQFSGTAAFDTGGVCSGAGVPSNFFALPADRACPAAFRAAGTPMC